MQTDYSWARRRASEYLYHRNHYDTQTGKELSLKGIGKDYDGIYDYVLKKAGGGE